MEAGARPSAAGAEAGGSLPPRAAPALVPPFSSTPDGVDGKPRDASATGVWWTEAERDRSGLSRPRSSGILLGFLLRPVGLPAVLSATAD